VNNLPLALLELELLLFLHSSYIELLEKKSKSRMLKSGELGG
jgi:hypothetical protein